MSASPRWKVYDNQGRYQAACKEPEAAGALMGFYGKGATIRDGHKRVVWIEQDNGAASYDEIAEACYGKASQP